MTHAPATRTQGQFLKSSKGPIFVLERLPAGPVRGSVLLVPPFAEEMNKCRRMVAEVSFGLAQRGWSTVCPDLYGTGDSEGDFSDACWDDWVHDLQVAAEWAAAAGRPVCALLALRLGAALSLDALHRGALPKLDRSVLWQPVFDGERALGQFLRLRVTAAMLEEGDKESLGSLKERLLWGETLEIAGYGLSSRMAADLGSLATPKSLPAELGQTTWMEVTRGEDGGLAPASSRIIDATLAACQSVTTETFQGEPFWSSTEIVTNDSMIARTVRAIVE